MILGMASLCIAIVLYYIMFGFNKATTLELLMYIATLVLMMAVLTASYITLQLLAVPLMILVCLVVFDFIRRMKKKG